MGSSFRVYVGAYGLYHAKQKIVPIPVIGCPKCNKPRSQQFCGTCGANDSLLSQVDQIDSLVFAIDKGNELSKQLTDSLTQLNVAVASKNSSLEDLQAKLAVAAEKLARIKSAVNEQ